MADGSEFEKFLGLLGAITDDDVFRNAHGFTLPEYFEDRDELVRIIRKNAKDIRTAFRELGALKASTGTVGIGTGAATLAGIALAHGPVKRG